MNKEKRITAVLADDEAHVRKHLRHQLEAEWPELDIVGEASNGPEALEMIQQRNPVIAFLDIRMPGISGMEVARQVASFCHVVFITAYDFFAIEAFEKGAIDYILKPVTQPRLTKTIERIRLRVLGQKVMNNALEAFEQALHRLTSKKKPQHLAWIRAQHSDGIRFIPVASIVYFRAEDKYTKVATLQGESLIRETIQSLEQQLDGTQFLRIHRSTIVNVAFIETVGRSLTGNCRIKLKQLNEELTVSRSYAHLFKGM